jgi:hypothetical protein
MARKRQNSRKADERIDVIDTGRDWETKNATAPVGYSCLVGGSSDLLLIQASTCGDLSGSMWSQSRHFMTGGGLPSGPKSKSMGLPQPGQGLRSVSVM